MSEMKIKFNPDLDHQKEAINAIVGYLKQKIQKTHFQASILLSKWKLVRVKHTFTCEAHLS
jgi:hypothetical protein